MTSPIIGTRSAFSDAIYKMEEDEKNGYGEQGNYQNNNQNPHQQQPRPVMQQPLAYGFVEPMSERRPTKYVAKRPRNPNNNVNKKYLKQMMEPGFRQRYNGINYPPKTPALSFNMLYGVAPLAAKAKAA